MTNVRKELRPLFPGFTLFELVLAIALSATLLALVGTAINLYLVRVDAGRTRVEEAQLARGILAMISADVRAATSYQPQDTSAIAQLIGNSASFDANSIDKAGTFKASALGTPSGTGTSNTSGAAGGSSAPSTTSDQNSTDDNQDPSTASVPGLNGTLTELVLDVSRLPRLDELAGVNAQSTAATSVAATNAVRPSDAKIVRYFIREGEALNPSDIAATSLSPDAQSRAGGLVRQTMDRAVHTLAVQSGDQSVLDGGQALIAPEVVELEFRYFDGSEGLEEWNMQERKALPKAIEVRIWFADSEPSADSGGTGGSVGTTSQLSAGRMYSETIDLPLAQNASATSATSSGSDDSSSKDSGGFGSSNGSSNNGTGKSPQNPPAGP